MNWQDTPIKDHSLPDVDEELETILMDYLYGGDYTTPEVIEAIKKLFKANDDS